ncbi:hypothetical protein [Micromonospora sp. NPDC050200]|uniref:hypothetical protein n=1 Tax=Micromonospora sp. NPDC050200 TaxID=3155664 RepID=UPI0033FF13ED
MTAPTVEDVEDVFLTTLRATLTTATTDDLAAIAQHWAGLTGHVADTARHLVDAEFETRIAVAHVRDSAHQAVAAFGVVTRRQARILLGYWIGRDQLNDADVEHVVGLFPAGGAR